MFWSWLIGYLIAGYGFVNKDRAEPIGNQPAYARSAKGRPIVKLFWPIVSIAILWQYMNWNVGDMKPDYIGGHLLPTWFLFLGIGAIGTLITSWITG